jgi:type IV fimbrial biogenesis protein FimT
MKTAQFGFSLVELMVTVAIATILASLAVPSFRTTLVGQTVESTADTLVSDIRFARSEAIKRTNRVTICGSSTGTSCYGANAWHNGWIVFVDDDGDGVVDTGDVVLRVQSAVTGISSIAATDGNARSHFVFQATGWSQSASQSFFVTPTAGSGVAARLVCVSNKGRAAIRAKGESACT